MDEKNLPHEEEQFSQDLNEKPENTKHRESTENEHQKGHISHEDQMRHAYHRQLNQSADRQQEISSESMENHESKPEEALVDQQKTEEQQAIQSTEQQGTKTAKKHRSKPKSFFQMVAAAIVGSALTLSVFTQTDYFHANHSTPVDQQEQQVNEAPTSAQPVSTTGSVADIVEQSSEAIVGIVNMSEMPQNPFQQTEGEVKQGVGSGVIYEITEDAAYIVTNNHVIEGASTIQVSLENGETVDGELVGADPLTDIAVVKIEGKYDIQPLSFGNSDQLRSGDEVIAIGNPLGLDLSRTVTQGIVSAVDRTIPVQTSAGQWEFDVIQTDAAINPGNSGGALINLQGELVGINSLKISQSNVEGLGFAIPSNEVKRLVKEISKNGQVVRPYVGVGLKSVSEIPSYYLQSLPNDVKDGVVVLSVDEDSAAGKAGVRVEDVIVSINGEKVANDNEFRSYLYKKLEVGDQVTIELYRDGKLKEVTLTLTSNKK